MEVGPGMPQLEVTWEERGTLAPSSPLLSGDSGQGRGTRQLIAKCSRLQ